MMNEEGKMTEEVMMNEEEMMNVGKRRQDAA